MGVTPLFQEIEIGQIMPDPSQPRKIFLDEEIKRLADSIVARGVLQPLRVRLDESRQCYIIISGESRWRAGKLANRGTLPCLVIEGELSEIELLTDQIIENDVRAALKPMELARSLAKLKALRGCTAKVLVEETGISPAHFCRSEALLTLPEEIQDMIDSGALPESIGYEISRLPDTAAQFELAHRAARKRMTRDQVAEEVRGSLKSGKPQKQRLSCKHDGVSINLTCGKLTLEKLNAVIEVLKKEGRKIIEVKPMSQQPD